MRTGWACSRCCGVFTVLRDVHRVAESWVKTKALVKRNLIAIHLEWMERRTLKAPPARKHTPLQSRIKHCRKWSMKLGMQNRWGKKFHLKWRVKIFLLFFQTCTAQRTVTDKSDILKFIEKTSNIRFHGVKLNLSFNGTNNRSQSINQLVNQCINLSINQSTE